MPGSRTAVALLLLALLVSASLGAAHHRDTHGGGPPGQDGSTSDSGGDSGSTSDSGGSSGSTSDSGGDSGSTSDSGGDSGGTSDPGGSSGSTSDSGGGSGSTSDSGGDSGSTSDPGGDPGTSSDGSGSDGSGDDGSSHDGTQDDAPPGQAKKATETSETDGTEEEPTEGETVAPASSTDTSAPSRSGGGRNGGTSRPAEDVDPVPPRSDTRIASIAWNGSVGTATSLTAPLVALELSADDGEPRPTTVTAGSAPNDVPGAIASFGYSFDVAWERPVLLTIAVDEPDAVVLRVRDRAGESVSEAFRPQEAANGTILVRVTGDGGFQVVRAQDAMVASAFPQPGSALKVVEFLRVHLFSIEIDDHLRYEWSLNGEPLLVGTQFDTNSLLGNPSPLEEGRYVSNLTVTTQTSVVHANWTFVVDRSKPTLEVRQDGGRLVVRADDAWSGISRIVAGANVSVASTEAEFVPVLPAGLHEIPVRVFDRAGNNATAVVHFLVPEPEAVLGPAQRSLSVLVFLALAAVPIAGATAVVVVQRRSSAAASRYKVRAAAPAAASVAVVGQATCAACDGVLKARSAPHRCSCGLVLHRACAERAPCPACGEWLGLRIG